MPMAVLDQGDTLLFLGKKFCLSEKKKKKRRKVSIWYGSGLANKSFLGLHI